MEIKFTQFCESLDTVHSYELTKNEVDDFDILRDDNDRPVGVSGRKLHHEFEDPHSGDVIRVQHDIRHDVDESDPKNPRGTRIEVSFTRSPGEGSSEQTYSRIAAKKGTLGIFGTISDITSNIVKKHGKGETVVFAHAENERVPAYSRMLQRKTGVSPSVRKYEDTHPMSGYSSLSFRVPGSENS